MHLGHPCPKEYPKEIFDEGITNGAAWYNIAGMCLWDYFTYQSQHVPFFSSKNRINLTENQLSIRFHSVGPEFRFSPRENCPKFSVKVLCFSFSKEYKTP